MKDSKHRQQLKQSRGGSELLYRLDSSSTVNQVVAAGQDAIRAEVAEPAAIFGAMAERVSALTLHAYATPVAQKARPAQKARTTTRSRATSQRARSRRR
ncbi:MAG: hypothetical protein AB7F31_07010 [Parachlamydiales bacterium]